MSQTRTQSELCTATKISARTLTPDHFLGTAFVSHHIISIKIPQRQSHKCGGRN